jgi:predicted DsbA family dithiol-disulfide isomerase
MTIKIEYFSDILCIWAYTGQVRMDELKRDFADDVEIEYRFIPIFAAAKINIEKNWKDKGGFKAFNAHLQDISKNWKHISISTELWTNVVPESSISAHLYLKAIQLLAEQGEIDDKPLDELNGRTLIEEAIWLFRDAFFRQGLDISRRAEQDKVAEKLRLPLKQIHQILDSGKAHAALYLDDEAGNNYKVPGSPTLVLNQGRQLLYGNVGYRIIDANVRELLHNPEHGEASWC